MCDPRTTAAAISQLFCGALGYVVANPLRAGLAVSIGRSATLGRGVVVLG